MDNVNLISQAADDLWLKHCFGKGNQPIELSLDEQRKIEIAVKQLNEVLAGQQDYETYIQEVFPFLRKNAA